MNDKFPGQIGESKVTVLDKQYDWGIYFWKKANGKPFTDGNGSVLNIPSHRGDALQIRKLEQEAKALGQGDGSMNLCQVLEEFLKKSMQNKLSV